MQKGFAIIVASLVVLAWPDRKYKLILFGSLVLLFFFGSGAAIDTLPGWLAGTLGLVGLTLAFTALGIALKRSLRFVFRKLRQS
jgi:hypothetical protein